jgi:hypothetical protein
LRRSSAAGLYDIEETLTFNILSPLTVPYLHAIEARRFVQVQMMRAEVDELARRLRLTRATRFIDVLDVGWRRRRHHGRGIDPMLARVGERVRIRVGNLTMTNHPMHLHGHEFVVTGTDGGWIPQSARLPEVTTDLGVGQMKSLEFTAAAPGDWVFHCHKSHHTMNAMGHGIPNTIGVERRDLATRISSLVPNYMNMSGEGSTMGEMQMQMTLPPNTLPMMTGMGPHGSIDRGGMFTLIKVRAGRGNR